MRRVDPHADEPDEPCDILAAGITAALGTLDQLEDPVARLRRINRLIGVVDMTRTDLVGRRADAAAAARAAGHPLSLLAAVAGVADSYISRITKGAWGDRSR